MSSHLNDYELAAASAGIDLDPEPLAHLERCISCRRSVDHFLDCVNERRNAIEDEAPNWNKQLEQILEGLHHGSIKPTVTVKARRWVLPLLAAAATIAIAIGTGLIVQERGPALVPTPRPDIQIEEILAQTDALLAEEGIPGFEILDDVNDDDLTALLGALNS